MARKSSGHGHVSHNHPAFKALRKHPALKKNYCFGCGKDNPDGMKLKFRYGEEAKKFVAHFRLGKRFTGPPRHAHGGIIAAILDEAMSKPSKPLGIMAPTIELTVKYLKPVPLGTKLTATGWEISKNGREHLRAAEILNEKGEVLSAGRGTFLEMDADRMIAKFVNVPGELPQRTQRK